MMDILKRIDQAQQFCNFYADGAYSVEKDKWNHHVNPEFIEDIRQYIEQLQLKLMHFQTQQAHKSVCAGESYDMIDRFLRNNLDDDNYAEYSAALDELCTPPAQRTWVHATTWRGLTDEEIEYEIHQANIDFYNVEWHDFVKFAQAIEAKLKEKNCG